MQENAAEIKEKLHSIYPEIKQFGLNLEVEFDKETQTWLATFQKGDHQLSTHMERTDVESCLSGKECYHLGIQLGRFIRHYCEGGDQCRL